MTNPRTTEAAFDSISFKREAQTRIYEAIRSMTPQEQLAYFRQQAEVGPLGEWWKRLPRAHPGNLHGED